MTVNFSLLALDQIVNNAATLRHMSGGQFSVPLVVRMATGGGRQLAAQHSHSLEGWYAHIPGITVVAPATSPMRAACCWRPCASRSRLHFRACHAVSDGRRGGRAAGPVDIEHAAVAAPGTMCRSSLTADRSARRCRPRTGWRPTDPGGSHRSAGPAAARYVDILTFGRTKRIARSSSRGLADGQPRRRDQRADHGAGLLRSRRAGAGFAAPKCRCPTLTSRRCGAAAGGNDVVPFGR